jgi:hypothetical protein
MRLTVTAAWCCAVLCCVAAGDGVHIMTGPIYVCGAEPGDILQVDILDLVPRKNPKTGKVRAAAAACVPVFLCSCVPVFLCSCVPVFLCWWWVRQLSADRVATAWFDVLTRCRHCCLYRPLVSTQRPAGGTSGGSPTLQVRGGVSAADRV